MRVRSEFIFSRKPQILNGQSHPVWPSADSKKMAQTHFLLPFLMCFGGHCGPW